MKQEQKRSYMILGGMGLVGVIYLALRIAPGFKRGLSGLIRELLSIPEQPFNIRFGADTPVFVFTFVAIYLLVIYSMYLDGKNYRRGEEYGSARWGNIRAARRKLMSLGKDNLNQNILMTQNLGLSTNRYKTFMHRLNHHVLVIGGSGAGKTRFYIIINILQKMGSKFILDPAGELLRDTGEYVKNEGYELKVFNIFQTDRSMRYNPFVYIRNDEDVVKMIDMFVKCTSDPTATKGDPFWDDAMRMLLMALCYYLVDFAPPEDRNFPTVQFMLTQMIISGEKREPNAVDALFEELGKKDEEHIAFKCYKAYITGAEKTLQSIQISLQNKLVPFIQPSIADLCCTTEDELGLFKMPETLTALYAVTPSHDTSKNFLVSFLYQQIFDILCDYGMEHGKLKVPIQFLMDEFANTKVPDNFVTMLTTVRKFGMSFSIILQAFSQLEKPFKEDKNTIVSNCDTMLYLGGNEDDTFKKISDKLGKQTIKVDSYSTSKGSHGSTSKSTQLISRDLMTFDEVAKLDNSKAIVFFKGQNPLMDDKYDLKTHPNYQYLAFDDADGKPYVQPSRSELLQEKIKDYMTGFRIRTDLTIEEINDLPPLPIDTDVPVYSEFFGPYGA